MPILRASTALLAVLILTASGLEAQTVPSPYRYVEQGQEANLFVGWFGGDTGRFGFGPAAAPVVGGRYGLELSGPLAIEGVAAFVPTERDVLNPHGAEGNRVVGQAASKLLMVDARLRFTLTGRRTWHGISPYLVAGGGVAFDVEGDQREDQLVDPEDRFSFGTEFTGVFGAGFKWLLREVWAIRTDAALQIYQLDVPGGYDDPTLDFDNVPESEWVNAGVLTIGLSRLF